MMSVLQKMWKPCLSGLSRHQHINRKHWLTKPEGAMKIGWNQMSLPWDTQIHGKSRQVTWANSHSFLNDPYCYVSLPILLKYKRTVRARNAVLGVMPRVIVTSDRSGTKGERWLPDSMVTLVKKGRKDSAPGSKFYCWDRSMRAGTFRHCYPQCPQ